MRQLRSLALGVFRKNGRQKGFTLVELLVVLSVFVLLISLTIPNYLATRPQRFLSSEANRMAAVVRQGRLFSLRNNAKIYLEFLPEIDTYRMWNEPGWRAYADVIMDPNELAGRHPEFGDYDGDYDGDGDFWWGDGGTPAAPTGNVEDPDVKFDAVYGWYYQDSDGIYTDPDVLLMPTYPGNQPIRTVSPKLVIRLDGSGNIEKISRDLGDTTSVAGDGIVPLEVDLRMQFVSWNNQPSLGKRNGVLSHFPLLFIVFFPDGTLACSWDNSIPSTSFADETLDLEPGRLGATQLHLQVRGDAFNLESLTWDLVTPFPPVFGDDGPDEPLSVWDTLSLQDSAADELGRVLTINNLSGRVIIRNKAPITIDDIPITEPPYL
ncbi:MAG: prepilin-type N-terminal cleavage/methylation domain-containing protein [bacterium]